MERSWSRRTILRLPILAAPTLAACGGAPSTPAPFTPGPPPVTATPVTALPTPLAPSSTAQPTPRPSTATAPPRPPASPSAVASTTATPAAPARSPAPLSEAIFRDPARPIEQRLDDLLARLSLAEKIGQMTQIEKNSIAPADVTTFAIGSILSGGGGSPRPNTGAAWAAMVDEFQRAALATRLSIPLLYGVDAVHGHNNVAGATIFPHNIGLGAVGDPALVERIGRATALEMVATGIRWNFAPVVAAPQDIRWGRTYEGYSEETASVAQLGAAFVRGLQEPTGRPALADPLAVLATPKHFIGDGGTRWGTATTVVEGRAFQIDQGDARLDEARLRALCLPPYLAAIAAGARCIMVTYNSWNGAKLHGHRYLLTDVLKGELGFSGFLVSDWQAIDQLPGDYDSDVVATINAGLDLIMVPSDYRGFIGALTRAIQRGAVPLTRIDDAVRRILRVKLALGLFERPFTDPVHRARLGDPAHRALAREAVRRSLVLLTNRRQTVPLAKPTPRLFIAGAAADDIGRQCGGWTIDWQGKPGPITTGTTILEGFRRAAGPAARIDYRPDGRFDGLTDGAGRPIMAEIGIAVVGEEPYAEGLGDSADLQLPEAEIAAVTRLRARCARLVVVLIAGRPLALGDLLTMADAIVVAWLPGSEGQGVADILFGDHPFGGRLPYTWPRSARQLPLDLTGPPAAGCDGPLFRRGHGLSTADRSPDLQACLP